MPVATTTTNVSKTFAACLWYRQPWPLWQISEKRTARKKSHAEKLSQQSRKAGIDYNRRKGPNQNTARMVLHQMKSLVLESPKQP